MRTKLRNLISGAVFDITFKGNEKLEQADISRSKAQFTYKDQTGYNFMNNQNFEQFSLTGEQIGTSGNFITEGMEVDVLSWNGKPINISPPIKVELVIQETEPGIRGNTAQGSVTKPAVTETGAKILVPIFICTGDRVRVNSETGEYVERVNKK